MMTIPGPDKKASGYLVVPVDASTGKHPALIVVHEWLGVDDWLKETTDRLAAKGYVALAVDLYRGKTAPDPATAHELMRGVPEDRALADLEAAFNYLASRSDVDPARIGAIGFCMGGGFALSLAVAEPRLRAAVTNYGRLVTDPATLGRVRASLLGNYGGVDNGIPVEDVRAFDAALHAAHKDVDIKIYESLGHGFMNPLDRAFSPEEARDAWQRIDAFFEKALKPR
jgi:carboxymethylenebutenolidase